MQAGSLLIPRIRLLKWLIIAGSIIFQISTVFLKRKKAAHQGNSVKAFLEQGYLFDLNPPSLQINTIHHGICFSGRPLRSYAVPPLRQEWTSVTSRFARALA